MFCPPCRRSRLAVLASRRATRQFDRPDDGRVRSPVGLYSTARTKRDLGRLRRRGSDTVLRAGFIGRADRRSTLVRPPQCQPSAIRGWRFGRVPSSVPPDLAVYFDGRRACAARKMETPAFRQPRLHVTLTVSLPSLRALDASHTSHGTGATRPGGGTARQVREDDGRDVLVEGPRGGGGRRRPHPWGDGPAEERKAIPLPSKECSEGCSS